MLFSYTHACACPRCAVCLIARATQLLLQVAAPPAAVSASAAALTTRSTRVNAATPLHPALAALHSLLLPPLLYPQAFAHLQVDTPKGLLLSGPPGVGQWGRRGGKSSVRA